MIAKHINRLEKMKKLLENNGVLEIANRLMDHFPSASVYCVGGTVRDALMEREDSGDVDLVVSGVDPAPLQTFLQSFGEVSLVGKSFGIFKFTPQDWTGSAPLDIALPRTDHAFMTGGYKDVEVQSDPNLPIEKDLERRDFTINALAFELASGKLIDVSSGNEDIERKLIRCVGDAKMRFAEDSTRMLRAVRFGSQLKFEIDAATEHGIKTMAENLNILPIERIRDEFTKIITARRADWGIRTLSSMNLLSRMIPELEEGIGVTQNKNHIYTVFEHNVHALDSSAARDYSFVVRVASLFHDIGKSRTKKGEGPDCTFYNHDLVGGNMTRKILSRMKYANDIIQKVSHLVRHHMFYYSIGQVTDAGVRRLLVRLGRENIEEFFQLRICDRLGMGRPKAKPYKLTELERRLQEVQMDPISPKMLAINGNDIMNILNIPSGPRIGLLTKALLSEVLDDPKLNTKEYLENRIEEINRFSDEELFSMAPDVDFYDQQRKEVFFKDYKEIQ
jgi:poly(A) polymerase/tRNA nucleotidyltransferase (CCA-adding enzyme)